MVLLDWCVDHIESNKVLSKDYASTSFSSRFKINACHSVPKSIVDELFRCDEFSRTMTDSPEKINLVIRLIRSFPYRNIKNLVIKDLEPQNTTVSQLKHLINHKIQTESAFIPHRTKNYDTLKIYALAQSHKPNCLVINLDKDEEQIMKDDKTIADYGLNHETELSFFDMKEYLEFKQDPETKW